MSSSGPPTSSACSESRCCRDRVEKEAERLLRPGTYLEPFALRALGIARADTSLVERARSGFEALGLQWHASETARLLAVSVRT